MALAEKVLAAHFNRTGHAIVDHRTWVFLGDGCLMEGISHEACALAGTLQLSKLVMFYDDNGISIDGEVHGWFTDDTPARFEAYGWNVIRAVDGHDVAAVDRAIAAAIEQGNAPGGKPTLICCKTIIGWGSPNKQGTEAVHGAALGAAEVAAAREQLGWQAAPFEIPADVRGAWDARTRGAAAEAAWQESFAAYAGNYPELAAEYNRRMAGDLPAGLAEKAAAAIAAVQAAGGSQATRQSSQAALTFFTGLMPELLGGSADLTGSNNTNRKGYKSITPHDFAGDYLHYGVREFGMTGIMNGMALHGGFVPFGGTFLVFSDYARNAVRMSALMGLPVINVYTHDSIGLGEDGPTHQPVEHTASLRLIPNHDVWRPCDAAETHVAWLSAATRRDRPTSLILTRQALPAQARDAEQVAAMARGGYVLKDAEGAQAVLIATGSEVALAVEAQTQLAARGIAVRVVSMPCTQVFEAQSAAWRDAVLPKGLPRVAVEAGVTDGWYRYVGHDGAVVGLNRFGASAPAKVLFEQFGFTPAQVAATVEGVLAHR
jgi:transketolase